MRSLLLATIAVFGLSGTVYAGEGNGEPFPGPDASVTTDVSKPVYGHKSQDPFQFYVPGVSTSVSNLKPLAGRSQDPFPFHAPDTVVALHGPITGPQSGTALTTTGQGPTQPTAEHRAVGRGSHG